MERLTKPQFEIMQALHRFIKKHRVKPLKQELFVAMGWRSRSLFHRNVDQLAELGFIEVKTHGTSVQRLIPSEEKWAS